MTKVRNILTLLVILIAFSGCHFKKKDPRIGKTFPASMIQVLAGNEFDIVLVDGQRVHAFLPVGTPPQAKEKVTKLINKCVSPRVVFQDKVDKGMVVDIEFGLPTCTGSLCSLESQSLVKWLKANGLAWE